MEKKKLHDYWYAAIKKMFLTLRWSQSWPWLIYRSIYKPEMVTVLMQTMFLGQFLFFRWCHFQGPKLFFSSLDLYKLVGWAGHVYQSMTSMRFCMLPSPYVAMHGSCRNKFENRIDDRLKPPPPLSTSTTLQCPEVIWAQPSPTTAAHCQLPKTRSCATCPP